MNFIVIPTPGIQNGGPDGIVLYNSNNDIIDSLSYEGNLVGGDDGTGGSSWDLKDIGVSENSSTLEGYSWCWLCRG